MKRMSKMESAIRSWLKRCALHSSQSIIRERAKRVFNVCDALAAEVALSTSHVASLPTVELSWITPHFLFVLRIPNPTAAKQRAKATALQHKQDVIPAQPGHSVGRLASYVAYNFFHHLSSDGKFSLSLGRGENCFVPHKPSLLYCFFPCPISDNQQ